MNYGKFLRLFFRKGSSTW